MRLHQELTISGKTYKVIEDDVRMWLGMAGRARFTVQADKGLSGAVVYKAGWSGQSIRNVFIGYVEQSITINRNQQLVMCRESVAVLDKKIPLALRHVNAIQVIGELTVLTGLDFAVDNGESMNRQVPYFYSLSYGYKTMNDIGTVYQIPRYVWQQRAEGEIYVGSWNNSHWAEHSVILPDKLLTEHAGDNSAKVGFMPALRPCVKTNRGVITGVTIKGAQMEIEWKRLENW